MKNQIRLVGALAVVMLLAVGMLGGVLAADDNTMTLIVTRDPLSLDPHGTLDPGAPVLLAYIYDTLVYQDKDGAIQPSLAESWEVSNDGLTITFKLQADVQFSDGSPLNADAVIYSFERLLEKGQRMFIYRDVADIESLEKIDDLTIQFNMKNPSVTLFSAISYPYAGILSPEATEAAGEDYGFQPIGTGPFILTDWVADSSLTLAPNPYYTGHRPWVTATGPSEMDSVTVRFVRDQAARANALIAGEADVAYLNSPPQVMRFEGNPDFTIMDSPGRAMTYLGFNTSRAPFDNLDVRQAIAQAVEKETIALIAAEGLSVVVNQPLAPSIFGYDPALESEVLTYDLNAARASLAAAGYDSGNPLELTILTSTFPTFQTISTILQAQLAEIGVVVNVEVLDYSAVREMATNGEYDLLVTRYDWNDPDVLRLYLGSENIGSTNRYFYVNDELDALIAEGRAAFNPETRMAIYADAQRIVMQDVPIVPLYMPITKVVMSNRIQGADILHSHVVLDAAQIAE